MRVMRFVEVESCGTQFFILSVLFSGVNFPLEFWMRFEVPTSDTETGAVYPGISLPIYWTTQLYVEEYNTILIVALKRCTRFFFYLGTAP
jgi:hypothetical protein